MFPFMIPQPIKMDTKFWANQHCSTFCKGAYSSFYPTNCYPFYSNSRTKSFCVIFNTFSLRNNTRSLNSILLHLFFTWRRRKRCDWRFYFARRQELLLYRCRSLEQRLYLLLPLLPLSQGAKKTLDINLYSIVIIRTALLFFKILTTALRFLRIADILKGLFTAQSSSFAAILSISIRTLKLLSKQRSTLKTRSYAT